VAIAHVAFVVFLIARFAFLYIKNAVPFYNERVVLNLNVVAGLRTDSVQHTADQRAWDVLEPLSLNRERWAFPNHLELTPVVLPKADEWTEQAAWLRDKQDVIAAIREASGREVLGFAYPSTLANPPMIAILQPYLGKMQQAARLLHADMELARLEGDGDRIADNLIAMCGLARQLDRNETTFDLITGVGISSRAINLVPRFLADVPTARLGDIERAISAKLEFGHERLLAFERTFAEDHLQRLVSDDGKGGGGFCVEGLRYLEDASDRRSSLIQRVGSPLMRRQFDRASLVAFNEKERAMLEAWVRTPPWERVDPRTVRVGEGASKLVRALSAVSSQWQMWPSLVSTLDLWQTERTAAVLGLRCERIKRQTGAFPASLDSVVRSDDGFQPIDRFTGEALLYRVTGDAVLITARGPDRDDDGDGATLVDFVRWKHDTGWDEYADCDEVLWSVVPLTQREADGND
jgi:hypothetical protein